MIGNGGMNQDFITDRDNREVQQQQIDEPQMKQFKENIIAQKDMEMTEVLDQISTVPETTPVTINRFKLRMRGFYIVIQSALVTVRYFQQNILYEVQQVDIHHVSQNDEETSYYHIISSRTRNRVCDISM